MEVEFSLAQDMSHQWDNRPIETLINIESTDKALMDMETYNCLWCKKEFQCFLSQYKGFAGRAGRKFCSQSCASKYNTIVKGNTPYKVTTGLGIYRRYKLPYCEHCRTTTGKLWVHHKDQDRQNNNITNLETLCASCHAKKHNKATNFDEAYKKMKRNAHGRFVR